MSNFIQSILAEALTSPSIWCFTSCRLFFPDWESNLSFTPRVVIALWEGKRLSKILILWSEHDIEIYCRCGGEDTTAYRDGTLSSVIEHLHFYQALYLSLSPFLVPKYYLLSDNKYRETMLLQVTLATKSILNLNWVLVLDTIFLINSFIIHWTLSSVHAWHRQLLIREHRF